MKCPRCGREGLLARYDPPIYVPMGDDFKGVWTGIRPQQIGKQAIGNGILIGTSHPPGYCPHCGNALSPEELRGDIFHKFDGHFDRLFETEEDDLLELDMEDADIVDDEVPEEGDARSNKHELHWDDE